MFDVSASLIYAWLLAVKGSVLYKFRRSSIGGGVILMGHPVYVEEVRVYLRFIHAQSFKCHSKVTSDFVFVGSSSLIATAGHSADNRNVCLWDTLLPQRRALVQGLCKASRIRV